MMSSLAIPLKKRRRPPSFWFWWNLFFVLFNVVFTIWDTFRFLETHHIIFLIGVGVQIACGQVQWGFFKREYDKWRDGE